MKNMIAITAVAGLAGVASAQSFSLEVMAPASAAPGDTYTVEVWGSWSGIADAGNGNALAGFGNGLFATEGDAGVASITTAAINSGLMLGSNAGTVNGADLEGVAGGQLANLFGFANPAIDLSNPIMLYSADVTVDGSFTGDITYTVDGFNVNGAIVVYPDSQAGASVGGPADGPVTVTGATTNIIPAPAGLAALGLGLIAGRRRR